MNLVLQTHPLLRQSRPTFGFKYGGKILEGSDFLLELLTLLLNRLLSFILQNWRKFLEFGNPISSNLPLFLDRLFVSIDPLELEGATSLILLGKFFEFGLLLLELFD